MSSPTSFDAGRRRALRCLAFGGAGTLFTLSGGLLTPLELARAATRHSESASAGVPLFVQISDTHIGFNKEANPDVAGTLRQSIALVNALPQAPALVLHTGDITHLSRPAEFDTAAELLGTLKVTELHTVPGEHDLADAAGVEYFNRYGKPSGNKGYYSFEHRGVHFVALINVLNFKPGGLGALGYEQLRWLAQDLESRSASTPIVVFAHMPLWSVYEPWGWGTADAAPALELLRRFGSVTILNGHIHQIVQKVEGNITFHTARSTAYPQPLAGTAAGPGPLQVPTAQLAQALGITSVAATQHPAGLALTDTTLGGVPTEDSHRIVLRDFMFSPSALAVGAGTTVTWQNMDDEPHTIASVDGLFRSNALDQGETFSFKFERPGTYHYACTIHPQMLAMVRVT